MSFSVLKNINLHEYISNPSLVGAKLISENKIIGWFHDLLNLVIELWEIDQF